MNIPVLIITGSVGVGKTSVAWEISELLENKKIPHAYVDADVCYLYPRPEDDPRGVKLYLKNLKSIWLNMQKSGASKLIITKVIESLDDIEELKRVLPNTDIQIIRLHAPIDTISERLNKREIGSGFKWHQERAIKLLDLWEKNPVEDHLIETDNRTIREIAEEILKFIKWA